ncbi:MAG: type II and III secretion system protein [Calditrichaeota bacterium]|nr:type II and III secretion system protein [Calditrichota bacterium]
MKRIILTTGLVMSLCLVSALFAQKELPREYTPPEELISLNSEIDISTALDLISEYAIQFAKKPIYDPDGHSGPIGVDIRSIPWKKALGLILSRRGLWYAEKPRYIQVISADEYESMLTGGGGEDMKLGAGMDLKPHSREVKIETVFFEGDRKALKEIGLDWSTFYQGKVLVDASQLGTLDITDNVFNVGARIPKKLIGVDLEVLLKAFDSKKIGKVLAQPQVVVTEGKEGTIQVGQDFSIKERDFAGNIIDRFYSTGTILKVTPYIIQNTAPDGKPLEPVIFLKIHVERSTAHPDVVSTIINKSQANSYLQLYDGEETLIAGLYSTEKNKVRKGVPILKDMPWWFLGFPYIFGYNRTEETEKELVIIIKATLLKDVLVRQKVTKTNAMNLSQTLAQNYRSDAFVRNDFSQIQASSDSPVHNFRVTSRPEASLVSNPTVKPLANSIPKVQNHSSITQYCFGKIIKIKNQLALIYWQRKPAEIKVDGKIGSIVRKSNSARKVNIIAEAKIIGTRQNRSVVKINKRRFDSTIRAGDVFVIKINATED